MIWIAAYLVIAIGIARMFENMDYIRGVKPTTFYNNLLGFVWPSVILFYFLVAMYEFLF